MVIMCLLACFFGLYSNILSCIKTCANVSLKPVTQKTKHTTMYSNCNVFKAFKSPILS